MYKQSFFIRIVKLQNGPPRVTVEADSLWLFETKLKPSFEY